MFFVPLKHTKHIEVHFQLTGEVGCSLSRVCEHAQGQEDTGGQEGPQPAEAPQRTNRAHLAKGCQHGSCSARGLFTAYDP